MASIFDQENLATSHQTIAANKPLNQSIRNLQPKTPGNHLKTPFRTRNDENAFIKTGKSTKTSLVTPAPALRTVARAPLGAKTGNAKSQAFQTPAPIAKASKTEQTVKKASSTRRTIKKKIYVEPEQPTQQVTQEPVQEEPDFGFAPPPIVPLADPPIDFEYDQTYPALKPGNFNRGVGEIYFQSPKDENGFSISLKKIEEEDRRSLQRDLDRILADVGGASVKIPDIDENATSARPRSSSRILEEADKSPVRIPESSVDTLKSRSAAAMLSQNLPSRTYAKSHARLPSAATAQTAASKQKRKSTYAVTHISDAYPNFTPLSSISNATIGFPKAKKAPSILPRSQNVPSKTHERSESHVSLPSSIMEEQNVNQAELSPRKFVELHGEPAVESDMWCRLKELEIRSRTRESEEPSEEHGPILDFDDAELDSRLALGFGGEQDDFELTLN